MLLKVIGVAAAILVSAYGWQVYSSQHAHDGAAQSKTVPLVNSDDVVALIRDNKKVIFVDAREPQEWAEEHIPGAINIPLRNLNIESLSMLGQADLIVAYCLKDFRGYEVAKTMKKLRSPSASILAEYGINGWKAKGFPTVASGQSDAKMLAMLKNCGVEDSHSEKCEK